MYRRRFWMNRKDLEHQVEAEARVKDRADEVIRKNASTINGLEARTASTSSGKENCRQKKPLHRVRL